MNSDRNFKNQLISFLEKQAHWIVITSVIIILGVTLLPFDFSIPQDLSFRYVFNRFRQTTNEEDLIVNIFFFMPLGLGLAAFWHKKNRLNWLIILTIYLINFSLSLFVEICQLFLISRAPTFTDVVTNSLGGCLGGILFWFLASFQQESLQCFSFLKIFRDPFIQLKSLTVFWLFYFFLMAFLLFNVQDSTKLSNWDSKFPLLVGNEATGDRSWSGQISYLCISKNSFNKEKIAQLIHDNSCTSLAETSPQSDNFITAYSFLDSQVAYPELTHNLPELEIQETYPVSVKNTAIVLDQKNWLKTKIPALKLTRNLQDSSQFTVLTKIATNNFKQEGPARIISLSQNHLVRNLTIAQWRKDLTLRVRMPLTGINGKKPEIRIRNFFNDSNFHTLAIAYDGLRLRTYVDQVENAHKLYLGSEAALFWSVFSIIAEKMYLNVANDHFYHLLYYSLIFAPLGICLGLIAKLLQTRLIGWSIFLIGGLIMPPLIIEAIITSNSNRFWNWHYLSLGLTVLTVSFMLTKWLNKTSKISLIK